MPRPAAIILGLTLVACSIWINMTRYPVVWEMVGAAQAGESAQPAADVEQEPADSQPSAAPLGPSSAQPVEPIEIKPAPEVGDEAMADDATLSAEREARKPLVPVVPIGFSHVEGEERFGVIRRLPPVGSRVAVPDNGTLAYGTIPIYPTTGIE